jgi:hypothetical protein
MIGTALRIMSNFAKKNHRFGCSMEEAERRRRCWRDRIRPREDLV